MDQKPDNPIGTLENRVLSESVADVLRNAILRGDFAPGERLNEVAVSKALNISRGPIREALRQLAQEGIVDLYPQRGGRVAEIGESDILAALEIRELLETMANKETCAAVKPEDISHLRNVMACMDEAQKDMDIARLARLDFQFHRDLLAIAATDTAQRIWTMLGGRLMMFQAIGNRSYSKNRSVALAHEPIIQALEARDETRLRSVILSHIAGNRVSIGCAAASEDQSQ
ncbi:GntR family transcriptional regulator [Paracoccus sp. MKU1]|uniref:GntR family transcriptional regulator n=1 Tax=Paracoccus sp. MKU1 TaxID=1745182 RepID=UPI000719087C|nr:GntR family transcriptional regulator [Paracoccus sp. MKU1]KRW96657.1 hypothetical protein AQY21_07990 [Paracoccus sp. MKU1]